MSFVFPAILLFKSSNNLCQRISFTFSGSLLIAGFSFQFIQRCATCGCVKVKINKLKDEIFKELCNTIKSVKKKKLF